ncbi:MAG: TolC family protein [Deltaproteobacteria bacterium]|nr:TolC family protein [Deltaproteobacteria bacterium]
MASLGDRRRDERHGVHARPGAGQRRGLQPHNFGRDRDTLKSAELEVDRSRESMHETERGVRFQVIQTVFNFKTRQDLLDVAQRSVESCESVLSLVRGRKSSRADVASAEIDLLNARNILIQSQTAYSQALWDLNLVLGDPIGHPYRVKSEVKFIKFRMTLDDVLSVYRQNAPAIHDARKTYEQRQAELRIAEKNALPLPVLQFSGFNFGYNFTSVGTFPNRDPGNVNFSLGLALSIPIIGDGGFLFQRALRQAEVRVEAAEVDLRNAANVNEVRARGLYTTLLQLEYAVDLNQRIFKQSSDVFEASLSALQNRSLYNRLDLKNALEQLRTAELALTSSVLDHYNAKLELANLIGVDRFPEENL